MNKIKLLDIRQARFSWNELYPKRHITIADVVQKTPKMPTSFIPNKIIYTLILPVFFMASCYRTQIPNEAKYREHDTYSEFIDLLKAATDTLNSDFERTSFIRQKTAELIDVGNGRKNVHHLDSNWPSWDGNRYYTIFLYDSATVNCGGSAHFLSRVFRDLGYESTTYDMGCPGALTHQLTLVWNKQIGDYIVQDAFFNASLTDKQNNPLGFTKLISLLSAHKSDEVKILQGDYNYIPDWDSTGITLSSISVDLDDTVSTYFTAKLLPADIDQPNELYYEREYQDVEFASDYIYNSCLIENHLPNDPLYLFLLPLEHNSIKLNLPQKSVSTTTSTPLAETRQCDFPLL